jgi:hypothetical protein
MVDRRRGSNTEFCVDGRKSTPKECTTLDNRLTRVQVQGDVLVIYVYQLRKDAEGNENVAVEKVSFRKNGGGVS